MKITLIAIISCFLSLFSSAQSNPDAILGKWITDAGNCIVQVYKQGLQYKAKVLWFDVKNKKPMDQWVDEKNPDKSLRSRKLVGMEVVNGLQYSAKNNEWVDGIIYDATTGKKWDSVVWLDKNNSLKVKGYWLFRWLSQTKSFKRADDYSKR